MSDSYQAIYDAVRSRIHGGDIGSVAERVMREAFDTSWMQSMIRDDISFAVAQHGRPSAVYRPRLFLDGNAYCALYGQDLMDGCAGFGDTPDEAMADFDKNWREMKAPPRKAA